MDNDYAYAFWFSYSPILIAIFDLIFSSQGAFMNMIRLFAGFLVIGSLILGSYLFISSKPRLWWLWLEGAFAVIIIIPLVLYVTSPAGLAEYVKVLIGLYAGGFIIGLALLKGSWEHHRERWWPYIGAVASLCVISIILMNYLLSNKVL